MNCMADSKENYKFDLEVEGLIGLNVLQKKKTRFIASTLTFAPCQLSSIKFTTEPHKCLQSYLMNPKLFLTPDLCIWKINRHTSS